MLSTTIAIPCPPPIQAVANPYFLCLRRNSYSSVITSRVPVAPSGCPSAIDRREEVRASAALECQSGEYRASITELDVLVDLCRNAGAVSASLTGAGLGGVITAVIEESRVPQLYQSLMSHYEKTEDAEVALVETAVQNGRIAPGTVEAIRAIRDAKRGLRDTQARFVPNANQQRVLNDCVRELVANGNRLVRLLPVDYYHNAVVRNVSVAGAGYIPAPN